MWWCHSDGFNASQFRVNHLWQYTPDIFAIVDIPWMCSNKKGLQSCKWSLFAAIICTNMFTSMLLFIASGTVTKAMTGYPVVYMVSLRSQTGSIWLRSSKWQAATLQSYSCWTTSHVPALTSVYLGPRQVLLSSSLGLNEMVTVHRGGNSHTWQATGDELQ